MRRDENEYPNDYWDKQEQQREEQTEQEEKGQEEKPSRAPVVIILSAIALLLIFLVVALGAAANQFTQWAKDKSLQVVADVKEHQSRAEERRKQQEEQEQKEQQKQQETESVPAWEDEDAEYYDLHSVIRDDLSYQVELEKVKLSGENDQEKSLYVITGEKAVIQGEGMENLDYLNDALAGEYEELQKYMEMITGDFEMDGAEPAQVSVDCYVTYMDEEVLSVVYNVHISMDYYGQVYLSCVNINMESGVVLHNLMDMIHVDDDFAIEFRERNAKQNQTDSIDYMSDQEVAAYLRSGNTGIAFFTPLGMEIGFNYEQGWVTVTYKDYEDYLGSL